MKQIYKSILNGFAGLCCLFAVAGCGDFLEITPRDIITEDNFWDEKTDIYQMVAGCYTAMQSSSFIERCIIWGDMRGEDIDGRDVSGMSYIYQPLLNNLQATNIYTDWEIFYHVINKCNTIIRMAPEVSAKDPAYRYSDVKTTIAEVTAIRSLCYWYLIRAFKDVPFSRDAIQQEDEVKSLGPSSFDDVLDALISDLESVKGDALEHYATSTTDDVGLSYNSNCNRITRNAIRAMLCDMYLWRGDYDLVIQNATEIMASKKKDAEKISGTKNLKLYIGENTLFDAYLYPNETSSPNDSYNAIFGSDGNSYESIFELSYNFANDSHLQNNALNYLFGKYDKNRDLSVKGWFCPMANVIAEGGKTSAADWQIFWGPSDTRFYCTMEATSTDYGEGEIRKGVANRFEVALTGATYKNFKANFSYDQLNYSNRNWIFYRLTDVMLMCAEAYIMKNPTSPEAHDLIDIVNQRSVVNNTQQFRKANKKGLLDALRRERRCELMFEGKNFFDIIRYCRQDGKMDKAQEIPEKCNSAQSANKFPSLDHMFWPYNREEVKKNPNLKQKSIYNKESDSYEMNN